jgi:hypothetical protein
VIDSLELGFHSFLDGNTERFDRASSSLCDLELLKLPKTAFLCSRKIPAAVALKCYEWAVQQRDQGHCIISGFHSRPVYD